MTPEDQPYPLIPKSKMEELIGKTLTDEQYKGLSHVVFEIASVIIESTCNTDFNEAEKS